MYVCLCVVLLQGAIGRVKARGAWGEEEQQGEQQQLAAEAKGDDLSSARTRSASKAEVCYCVLLCLVEVPYLTTLPPYPR